MEAFRAVPLGYMKENVIRDQVSGLRASDALAQISSCGGYLEFNKKIVKRIELCIVKGELQIINGKFCEF